MTNQETCPHCGAVPYAEKVGDLIRFDCGTVFDTDEWVTFERSDDCYEQQIKKQAAEIERLRQSVLDEREACAAIADVYALGLERNYSELIADEIRARGEVK